MRGRLGQCRRMWFWVASLSLMWCGVQAAEPVRVSAASYVREVMEMDSLDGSLQTTATTFALVSVAFDQPLYLHTLTHTNSKDTRQSLVKLQRHADHKRLHDLVKMKCDQGQVVEMLTEDVDASPLMQARLFPPAALPHGNIVRDAFSDMTSDLINRPNLLSLLFAIDPGFDVSSCVLHWNRTRNTFIGNFRGKAVSKPVTIPAPLVKEAMSVWQLQSSTGYDGGALEEGANVELTDPSCPQTPSFVEEKMVFLEEGATVAMGFLAPIIDIVAKPILDQFLSIIGDQAAADLAKNVGHNMQAGVPRLTVGHVTPSVARNVTNLLIDSLTSTITERVSTSLTNALGPDLSKKVVDHMVPALLQHMESMLDREIPEKVDVNIPMMVERSLPLILTAKLTRSVTHALVPTLTQSLTHNTDQDRICGICRQTGEFCAECHYSRESQYYLNFASAYYADYFSDYYGDYYLSAMMAIDDRQYRPTENLDPTRAATSHSWQTETTLEPSKPGRLKQGMGRLLGSL